MTSCANLNCASEILALVTLQPQLVPVNILRPAHTDPAFSKWSSSINSNYSHSLTNLLSWASVRLSWPLLSIAQEHCI